MKLAYTTYVVRQQKTQSEETRFSEGVTMAHLTQPYAKRKYKTGTNRVYSLSKGKYGHQIESNEQHSAIALTVIAKKIN